jgi:hypothetical protein
MLFLYSFLFSYFRVRRGDDQADKGFVSYLISLYLVFVKDKVSLGFTKPRVLCRGGVGFAWSCTRIFVFVVKCAEKFEIKF